MYADRPSSKSTEHAYLPKSDIDLEVVFDERANEDRHMPVMHSTTEFAGRILLCVFNSKPSLVLHGEFGESLRKEAAAYSAYPMSPYLLLAFPIPGRATRQFHPSHASQYCDLTFSLFASTKTC